MVKGGTPAQRTFNETPVQCDTWRICAGGSVFSGLSLKSTDHSLHHMCLKRKNGSHLTLELGQAGPLSVLQMRVPGTENQKELTPRLTKSELRRLVTTPLDREHPPSPQPVDRRHRTAPAGKTGDHSEVRVSEKAGCPVWERHPSFPRWARLRNERDSALRPTSPVSGTRAPAEAWAWRPQHSQELMG